mmetsp:Transcript_29992/g.45861  ORF Transcript_29992/g.45861 Transcript_29992/m.45861 type:complete len:104 (+) Transcript_29992:387-698(+)
MERGGHNNLYGRVKRRRMTRAERNAPENIESHLHPSLLANDRVSIEKYSANVFKRGLQEGEEPFPVISKVGPYVVSTLPFTQVLLRSRSPCSVPRTTTGALAA